MVLSISKYVIKKSIFDEIYHRYALHFKDVTQKSCKFLEDSVYLWSVFCIIFHKHAQSFVCRHLIVFFI